jgi:hypothetical protein
LELIEPLFGQIIHEGVDLAAKIVSSQVHHAAPREKKANTIEFPWHDPMNVPEHYVDFIDWDYTQSNCLHGQKPSYVGIAHQYPNWVAVPSKFRVCSREVKQKLVLECKNFDKSTVSFQHNRNPLRAKYPRFSEMKIGIFARLTDYNFHFNSVKWEQELKKRDNNSYLLDEHVAIEETENGSTLEEQIAEVAERLKPLLVHQPH